MTSPTISDVELTFDLCRKIESALVERGATGTGLRDKAMCFEAYLPSRVWNALRTIGRERNHVGHVHGGVLSDREGYVRACELVLQAIQAIPAHAVATLPPARPGFRSPYRTGFRDLRPSQSSPWELAGGMVANHVQRKVRRTATGIASFFILVPIAALALVIASTLSSSQALRTDGAKTTVPTPDTLGTPWATTSKSDDVASAARDRLGARGADVVRGQRNAAKAGSLLRSPARVAASTNPVNDALPGTVPPSLDDALPRLEATDSSGQRRVAGADLSLGKLAAPPPPAREQHHANPSTKPGNVDLRSQDLESF